MRAEAPACYKDTYYFRRAGLNLTILTSYGSKRGMNPGFSLQFSNSTAEKVGRIFETGSDPSQRPPRWGLSEGG